MEKSAEINLPEVGQIAHGFVSRFHPEGVLALAGKLPKYSGTRVQMMPFIIGDHRSIPNFLAHYSRATERICQFAPDHHGKTGYLTIDEKILYQGQTTRRPGLHVDGVYRGTNGSWAGGGWGSVSTGMLTVSSVTGCRAWRQTFYGVPGDEGDCEHLRPQAIDGNATEFEPGRVYWLHGLCVHESFNAFPDRVYERQFVRVSLPSTAPWFEGYTVNPRGVLPTGPILPRREFMNQ